MSEIKVGSMAKIALHYTAPNSGASIERAYGAVIGVVSTLMAVGMTWDQAVGYVALHLPDTYRAEAIPDAWRDRIAEIRSVGR